MVAIGWIIPAAIAVFIVLFLRGLGLKEANAGLRVFNRVRWVTLAWEDLAAFDVHGGRVGAERSDGARRLLPVKQGARLTWAGGETRNIAHVLVDHANKVLRDRGEPAAVGFRDPKCVGPGRNIGRTGPGDHTFGG